MMVKSVAGVAWTAQSWPGGHGRAYQDTPAGRTIHNLRFSGSQLCPVSARRQGAARMSRTLTFHRVSETRCKGAAQRPGYVEESKAHTLSTSSLRAQRLVREALAKAEGESLRGGRLDCFAALAMAPAVHCAKSTRRKNRTAAYRWCQSLGLPCAMIGLLMPCSPGS